METSDCLWNIQHGISCRRHSMKTLPVLLADTWWGESADHRWIPLTKDRWCRALIFPLLLGLWFESHVAHVTSLQCSPTVILIRIFLWLGINGTIGYLEARVNDTAVTMEHQSHSVARWCQGAWESFAAVFKVPDVRWFRAVVKCQTVITAIADCLKVESLLCQFNKLK